MPTTTRPTSQLTAPYSRQTALPQIDIYGAVALRILLDATEAATRETQRLTELSSSIVDVLALGRFNANSVPRYRLFASVTASLALLSRTLPRWGYSVDATLAGAKIEVDLYPPGEKLTAGIRGSGATLQAAMTAAVLRTVLAGRHSHAIGRHIPQLGANAS